MAKTSNQIAARRSSMRLRRRSNHTRTRPISPYQPRMSPENASTAGASVDEQADPGADRLVERVLSDHVLSKTVGAIVQMITFASAVIDSITPRARSGARNRWRCLGWKSGRVLVSTTVTLCGTHGWQHPPIGGPQNDHRSAERSRRLRRDRPAVGPDRRSRVVSPVARWPDGGHCCDRAALGRRRARVLRVRGRAVVAIALVERPRAL